MTEEVPEKKVEKIMCFVSKQMVPVTDTIEVEYAKNKKVRVLPKYVCLLYTSPSPRDLSTSRMPSSA